ncbi:hypothetical protein HK098_006948 [Nowakowskiella sp. JEL0407]|nr:hypothetical protein HK098_006948 [Nowakowskiella sp. JEL0407]
MKGRRNAQICLRQLPYDILLPIFLQLNSPKIFAASCIFLHQLSKEPSLRFSFVRVRYLRPNYEYVRDLLDRVCGSPVKASLINLIPTKFRNLLDTKPVCEWACQSNLDMEYIELARHLAAVSRYLDATRGFVENLERNLKRLDDGTGKAERMLGIRAAYGLKVAIYNSDIEHVKIYLSSDFLCGIIRKFLETSEFAETFSPLLYNPDRCSFPFIQEILSKIPIYVSIPNRHGNSALKLALSRRKLNLARTLIPLEESDILVESGTMRSSLQLAISTDDTEVLKLILLKLPEDHKISTSKLISACARMGSEKQLKYLMTSSIPQVISDLVDFQRVTHLAASRCNTEIVSFLVNRCPSAVIELRNADQTPELFQASSHYRYVEFANMLLDLGLVRPINRPDSKGITPLQGLFSGLWVKPRLELLKRFLELGGDPLVKDKTKGRTSFHHFAYCRPYERIHARSALELLLSNSPLGCIDSKDDDGFTPLGLAVAYGDPANVEYLLEFGADVGLFSTETQCFPPAMLLSRRRVNVARIYELLLRNGMDPSIQLNAKGRARSLLQVVRLSRNLEIEKMLIRFGAKN